MRLIPDFSIYGRYFFEAPKSYENEVINKRWKVKKVKLLLEKLIIEYSKIDDFNLKNSEEIVREITSENEVNAGVLIHALRLAVTGFGVSPSIFDVLILIGKNKVIKRIKLSLKYGKENGIFI